MDEHEGSHGPDDLDAEGVAGMGGPGGDASSPSEPGSLGEETLKLLGTLAGWARDQGSVLGDAVGEGLAGAASGAADTWHAVDEHLAQGTCRYCPLCRSVEMLRELSPEVRDHLAQAAGSMAKATAGLLITMVRHAGTSPGDRAGVEHIDLDDGTADWPDAKWSDAQWSDAEWSDAERPDAERSDRERPEESR